ncbi:class IV aminotransferase [Brevundimonas sp. LM2]|uniref:aminotransferase class IV n=1 Tax=Brevundimonas sp. LM2 TaxID=1938605 RepID=UPI000983F9AE|nr:aminotransferase class IV [Brevundimonas sp. LM2]AQR61386.1 class IV aminotransferase [Brevundimonas sp. LM2]
MTTLLIDGRPASEEDLHYLATVNYGAYTSFRLEDGGVRGLALHLARLEASSREVFGAAVGEGRLREILRAALSERDAAWVRLSLFSPDIRPRMPSSIGVPKVMTTVSPPPPPLAESLRLQVQTYGREVPHIKHTANMGLIRARRLAQTDGFDDALFADADGVISEGSSWNVGFVAGDTVVWPQAPMLAGVAQTLIARGVSAVGLGERTEPVRVADLTQFDAAFICNSATPACPVTGIDDHAYHGQPALMERLRHAWAANPVEPI